MKDLRHTELLPSTLAPVYNNSKCLYTPTCSTTWQSTYYTPPITNPWITITKIPFQGVPSEKCTERSLIHKRSSFVDSSHNHCFFNVLGHSSEDERARRHRFVCKCQSSEQNTFQARNHRLVSHVNKKQSDAHRHRAFFSRTPTSVDSKTALRASARGHYLLMGTAVTLIFHLFPTRG